MTELILKIKGIYKNTLTNILSLRQQKIVVTLFIIDRHIKLYLSKKYKVLNLKKKKKTKGRNEKVSFSDNKKVLKNKKYKIYFALDLRS